MAVDSSKSTVDVYIYRDQVHTITNWFESWNECEQTVTLFSLMKRLNFKQTKFLLTVLEQNLSLNTGQLTILESQANDAGHLKSLLMPENSSIFQLLSLLPLLRPDNEAAAEAFVSLIPACLSHCLDKEVNLEECRQLISYALIHPGLSNDQRGSLSHWLLLLDQRETVEHDLHSGSIDSPIMPAYNDSRHTTLSATLSAPSTIATPSFVPRTMTTATPPTPLSCSPDYDSSYGGSTGSLVDTCEKHSISGDRSGMQDVPMWLKGLRLHKYSQMFNQFTYEDMLALDDQKLSSLGVTKGARHKIVLSVNKLNERAQVLRQMEKDVIESAGNVKQNLHDLKQLLSTPIKSYLTIQLKNQAPKNSSIETVAKLNLSSSLDDIPTLVCNVFAKLCSQILLHPDDENCTLFIQNLDRCGNHEAFSPQQRQRILQWKTQCQKLSRHNLSRNTQFAGNATRKGSSAGIASPGQFSTLCGNVNGSPHYGNQINKASVGVIGSNLPLTQHYKSSNGFQANANVAVTTSSCNSPMNYQYNGSTTTYRSSNKPYTYRTYDSHNNTVNATVGYHGNKEFGLASVHVPICRTQSAGYPSSTLSSNSSGTSSRPYTNACGSGPFTSMSNHQAMLYSRPVRQMATGPVSGNNISHSFDSREYRSTSVCGAGDRFSSGSESTGFSQENERYFVAPTSPSVHSESISRLESLCRSMADHALSNNDFSCSELGLSQ